MLPSILEGMFGDQSLNTFFENKEYSPRLFETFLPWKPVHSLTYEVLLGSYKNIAADLVAYDTSAPQKTRRTLSKLIGTIPATRIKRLMSETNLNNLLALKGMANPDKSEIMEILFEDVNFVFKACTARMEWLALKALSYGEVALTKDNNNGLVTEANIDYQIADSHKTGAAVIWSAAVDTTTPITDFNTAQASALADGKVLKFALMSPTSFKFFRSSQSTIDFAWGRSNTSPTKRPNLAEINAELSSDGLPTIVIMDSFVDLETDDHEISSEACWTEGYCTFLAEQVIGRTLTAPLASSIVENKAELKASKGAITVRKWSKSDPVSEFTLGETNSFPVIEGISSLWMLNTLNAGTWS